MALCKKCKRENKEPTNRTVLKCTVDSRGRHHSFGDRPAFVWRNHTEGYMGKRWEVNGIVYRSNGKPSVVHLTNNKIDFEKWTNENGFYSEGDKVRK